MLGLGQWLATLGARDIVPHPGNWLGGPFFLDAAVPNGSTTSVDLAAQDAWYGDAQARGQYGPANGSATKLVATLQVEAVELLMVDGDFTTILATLKDNIWSSQIYLQAIVGGQNYYLPLDNAITDLIRAQYGAATVLPATTVGTQIVGVPFILPSPIRIDLQQDTFNLAFNADPAFGAAMDTKVCIWGALYPNNTPGAGNGAPTISQMPRYVRRGGAKELNQFIQSARASYLTKLDLLTGGRPR